MVQHAPGLNRRIRFDQISHNHVPLGAQSPTEPLRLFDCIRIEWPTLRCAHTCHSDDVFRQRHQRPSRQRFGANPAPDNVANQAFLADDPYLELPHLRREPGETVGIFLSDLANGAIEDGPAVSAIGRLDMLGLGLTDNDRTAQLFGFFGCELPGRNLDFAALGVLLSDWLIMADVEAVLCVARDPAVLRYVTEESGLPITRAVLQ